MTRTRRLAAIAALSLPVILAACQQPAPPPAPTSVTILDPCDPAIDALPTTEDQSFAGWRPPACFESSEDIAGPGPAPIIGSPGHGA
jgi:hypothetical protein